MNFQLQSRLALDVPGAASGVYAVAARGAQSVRAGLQSGSRLETDLGPVATLQVRWRQTTGASAAAELEAREAYLWHL